MEDENVVFPPLSLWFTCSHLTTFYWVTYHMSTLGHVKLEMIVRLDVA